MDRTQAVATAQRRVHTDRTPHSSVELIRAAPIVHNPCPRRGVEAMESPNVRERLEGLGAVIVPPVRATPEYLAHFVRSEIEKWTGPIKASGVTVE
jgi:hypothetical protein